MIKHLRKLLLVGILCTVSVTGFAAEQIVDFEAKSLPVLNEELKRIDHEINQVVPTGVMMIWTTDTAPDGWLLCYGQAISRTKYEGLYNVIGTTYGAGDASTTFNVPDMRGRFPLGQDDMGGTSANRVTDTDADALAGADGDEKKDISFSGNTGSYTLEIADIPSHTHVIQAKNAGSLAAASVFTHADTETNDLPGATQTTGGGGGHAHTISGGSATQDFLNPFQVFNYVIKF